MGTDPADSSSFAIPEVGVASFLVEEQEDNFLYFAFQKITTGVLDNYVIEQSRNLENWEPADGDLVFVSEESAENGLSVALYRSVLPFDNEEKKVSFMRLRVLTD
jgi:hypothetical protein